ncbi:MAG: hypothetical protein QXU98_13200 [Candidatus Parvarchaeota archaeon]
MDVNYAPEVASAAETTASLNAMAEIARYLASPDMVHAVVKEFAKRVVVARVTEAHVKPPIPFGTITLNYVRSYAFPSGSPFLITGGFLLAVSTQSLLAVAGVTIAHCSYSVLPLDLTARFEANSIIDLYAENTANADAAIFGYVL